MDTLTPKGWTEATLAQLGVTRDGDRWLIPVHGDDGLLKGELRYSDTGAKPKMLARAGELRDLFPAPESVPGDVLYVVEGEPDAITMTEMGFAAVGYPGTGKDDPEWAYRLARGRERVVLIPDCDTGGRVRALDLAAAIAVYTPAFVAELDENRHDGFDVGDLYADALRRSPESGRDAAVAYIKRAAAQAPTATPPSLPPAPQSNEGFVVTNLSTIEPRKMRFLWPPYMPLGSLVIVAGAPGHGKSQFAALIAAMASRGALPGDIKEASKVLLLSAEDDLAATVVPRLMAVNADIKQVETINVRTVYASGLTVNGMIQLPGDIEAMHEWIKANPTARLIVLDPVVSFFDRKHNALYNQDVRAALGPLAAIADMYGVTVVVVLHLNKSESKDFANRIAESHGFQALARSVLALGPDPADPEGERGATKVIAMTKANLVKPGNHSMRCEVRSVTLTHGVPEPIETSELVLLGKCEISADDLLLSSAERTARVETKDWLAEFVGDTGWRKVTDVKKAAASDGIAWRTIERVRKAEGYQRVKGSGEQHGGWWIGGPRAHARDVPKQGSLGGVDGVEGQDRQRNQGGVGGNGSNNPATPPRHTENGTSRAREGLDLPFDQGAYREWEDRRLGERDDEDDG